MKNAMTVNYAATHENLASLEEARLVSSAKMGDLESFNQIVLLYQDMIFSLARRILGDADLAEDIAQNTFLAAFRNLPGFRNGSFRSWLYRIAVNACYDELRWRKRHPLQSIEFEEDAEEIPLPHYDFPGSTMLPENEVERHELVQVIQEALDQLDADQRTVVSLVDLQDFDYQEAAQILGVPLGTLKSRLARARQRLRFLLTSGGYIKRPLP
jgi:RNA polymerase sigma-70 factor (ECF subfamily)